MWAVVSQGVLLSSAAVPDGGVLSAALSPEGPWGSAADRMTRIKTIHLARQGRPSKETVADLTESQRGRDTTVHYVAHSWAKEITTGASLNELPTTRADTKKAEQEKAEL